MSNACAKTDAVFKRDFGVPRKTVCRYVDKLAQNKFPEYHAYFKKDRSASSVQASVSVLMVLPSASEAPDSMNIVATATPAYKKHL